MNTLTDDLSLPPIGLGTGGFAGEFTRNNTDPKKLAALIEYATECGMRIVDTAEVYADGKAEEVIGLVAKPVRNKLFIMSKFSPDHNQPQQIRMALEASLNRIQRDFVDVYQPHWPSSDVPFADVYETLVALQKEGKIRHIGLSNHAASHIQEANKIAPQHPVRFAQAEYNILERSAEQTLIPAMVANKGKFVAYSPLREGLLLKTEKNADLMRLAQENKCTSAQLLLAWTIRKEPVITIPKSAKRERIKENADVMKLKITPASFTALEELFKNEIIEIMPRKIQVHVDDSSDRKIYTNLEDAKKNIYGLKPGPMEIVDEILANNGQLSKPIKVKKVPGQDDYLLIGGRVKYWGWVILYGYDKPIQAILEA